MTRMNLSSILSSQHLGRVLDAVTRHSFHAVMISEAKPGTPVIYVNEAFTALTGYSAEETLGKSPGFLQGPSTDRAVLDRLRDDTLAGRVFEGEAVNYRKDRSAFTMHWRVVPVDDGTGKAAYFIAFQREAASR